MEEPSAVDELAFCIRKKDFKKSLILAQEKGRVNELVSMLSTNLNYREAFRILKQLNLDFNNYPELLVRAKKSYLRFAYFKFELEFVELLFSSRKEFLVYFAEELQYKNEKNKSLSVVKRHNLAQNLLKKELRSILDDEFDYIPNEYLQWDKFLPLESLKNEPNDYIKFDDYGVKEENVFVFSSADDANEAYRALKSLRTAKVIGLDTEGNPGFVPFQDQPVDLLQISDERNVYLFNLCTLSSKEFFNLLRELFFDKSILKLGFQFKNDIKCLHKIYKEANLYVTNYIDIADLAAVLYVIKKPGLTHLCKRIFGKNLSKLECFLPWDVHPLTKYQKHYAALDAFILGRIYEKLKKEFSFDDVQFTDSFGVDY